MEIRKDLELVDVAYENNDKKAVLTFLDKERSEVRDVNFNRQAYDNGKYVDSVEKAEQVDEWCKKYFDVPFNKLRSKIGCKKDVYCYDKFNSLWECATIDKFTKDQVGQIIQTKVKDIQLDDIAIRIHYDDKGKCYESKMSFADYVESMKKWFVNPQKRDKVFEAFEEKFGVPVEERDKLIGHPLMVEVKSAFGSNYYGDIKKFPKEK